MPLVLREATGNRVLFAGCKKKFGGMDFLERCNCLPFNQIRAFSFRGPASAQGSGSPVRAFP
jgi:hypothetical protein